MKKSWIFLYLLISIAVGVGCFFAFIGVVFNLSDGFLSNDNKPFAMKVGVSAIAGLIIFFYLSKKLIKDNKIIICASVLILTTAFFTWPVIQEVYHIKDNFRKAYATNSKNDMVSQSNQAIINSNLKFNLNLESSHYDTVYYNDILRINIEKDNEENLTLDELEKLIKILPQYKTGYRISILYGKYNYEYKRKEHSIAIFLDMNKSKAHCSGDDYKFDMEVEKQFK